ncbi:MAG: bifunctional folylpolyglutamate synthase/dihydrofolate synthase [Micavibrio aeruginosavorus]|nr:bifunctional folylpolyglutamate synthase/dihydrofolate synthase [Micavibrio aeruginosavorus]
MTLAGKLDFICGLRRDYRADTRFRSAYMALLDSLGNPHRNLPPVIHVAGTNGKGSTIAFMRAILEAAGLRVHVYTSPHLLRANERIVLSGGEIVDDMLEFLIDEALRRCPDPTHPDLSFFEFFTACAFTAFAHSPADILLLETGLGGALDCTNVVEHPLITVITTLSYDHTETLGSDLTAIAAAKAGIMKPEAPCVAAHQIYGEVLPVLRERAGALAIPLYSENDGWRAEGSGRAGDLLRVATAARTVSNLPAPCLHGAHQLHNAATAVAALMLQDRFEIPDEAFAKGLTCASWPARLQKIGSALLPPSWELWLDGGHNDSAALVLADQARAWQAADGRKLHIVTAMMGHKDAARFAGPLAGLASSVTAIPGHHHLSSPGCGAMRARPVCGSRWIVICPPFCAIWRRTTRRAGAFW